MVLMEKDDEERIQGLDSLHQDACARVQELVEKRRQTLAKLAIASAAIERHELDLEVHRLGRQWLEAVENRDQARRNLLDEYRRRGDIGQAEYERECKALDREHQLRMERHGQRDMINEYAR